MYFNLQLSCRAIGYSLKLGVMIAMEANGLFLSTLEERREHHMYLFQCRASK